ncbi:MAG: 4'-phosphopantetheinyl transferase superfamily protein [Nostoc sp.]|uniref:4'-phosphopantetheinyl transferase family protein n=1 Tax=Nostoc sp. TaxID=1180 RepID=UPI002FF6A057
MSDAELAYFEGLPVLRRQTSFLLGRFVSKKALAALVGEEDYRAIAITFGVFGQPIVTRPCAMGYDISISHNSRQAIAIAFEAGHPMGIDIETVDPTVYETLLNAVPAEEVQFLDHPERPSAERLLVLWTVKEALSKALRCGLMTPASVLAIATLEHTACDQYQSVFRNFSQYKALSWVSEATIISIVLPLHTEIEFDPFQ